MARDPNFWYPLPRSPPLQRPCQRAKLPYRAARRILTCSLRSRGSEGHHLQRSARVSCKDSQGYEAIVPPNPPPAHACWAGHIKRCHHQSVFGRRPRPQRPRRPSALRISYPLNDDHSVSTLARETGPGGDGAVPCGTQHSCWARRTATGPKQKDEAGQPLGRPGRNRRLPQSTLRARRGGGPAMPPVFPGALLLETRRKIGAQVMRLPAQKAEITRRV